MSELLENQKQSSNQAVIQMVAIQQQMVEAKKNERAKALEEVKLPCKEFGLLLEC